MKVVLIGSGNVATSLAQALIQNGHIISQVFSRNLVNAQALAKLVSSQFTDRYSEINDSADVYILALSDSVIPKLAAEFPHSGKLLVHTSGSTSLFVPGISGVIYPLQTFSKARTVDFDFIPIVIEGIDSATTDILFKLASTLSSRVIALSSEQRKSLHLAAVFACNFSNHLYTIAEDVLIQNEMDFDLLRPLILETAEKIKEKSPQEAQTGPAARGDMNTVNLHLQLLNDRPLLKELYAKLSQSIINLTQKA